MQLPCGTSENRPHIDRFAAVFCTSQVDKANLKKTKTSSMTYWVRSSTSLQYVAPCLPQYGTSVLRYRPYCVLYKDRVFFAYVIISFYEENTNNDAELSSNAITSSKIKTLYQTDTATNIITIFQREQDSYDIHLLLSMIDYSFFCFCSFMKKLGSHVVV